MRLPRQKGSVQERPARHRSGPAPSLLRSFRSVAGATNMIWISAGGCGQAQHRATFEEMDHDR